MSADSTVGDLKNPKYDIIFSKEFHCVQVKHLNSGIQRQFVQKFHFDNRNYERALFKNLPDRFIDLLEIANSVFLADRLSLRKPIGFKTNNYRYWKRELILNLYLRDITFWQNPNVIEKLKQVLDYLTEDHWIINLNSKPSSSKQLNFDFYHLKNTFTALFSGGLDSFAGITSHLSENKYEHVYLLSVVTNKRMKGVQKSLTDTFAKKLNTKIFYVPIFLNLNQRSLPGSVPEHFEEKTQRSRGFLFTVYGSVFSMLAGSNILGLFENGIGAINLPMVNFQIGTDNTRSVNPIFLIEISKLLSEVFDTSFEIKNFAQWLTKAELCKKLKNSPLREDVNKTVSCDGSFSRRVRRKTQCGICTSCLLRRQALAAAELNDIDLNDNYQFDIYRLSTIRERKRLSQFKAMQYQISKIKSCLDRKNAWFELAKSFPNLEEMKLRVCGSSKNEQILFQEKVLNLYSKYLNEWNKFKSLFH